MSVMRTAGTATGAPQASGGRDRGIDGVRAYATVGVVLGHWLVTALVRQPDGSLVTASPLAAMPALVPATWFAQTLGLFFFAAGYGSGRSWPRAGGYRGSLGRRGSVDHRRWVGRRLGRLLPAAGLLLVVAAVTLVGAAAVGVPAATRSTVVTVLVSPLWFLVPFGALVALTGVLRRLLARHGPVAVAGPAVLTVAGSDLVGRAGPHVPTGWRTPLALLAAWLVPYLMGLVVAEGGLRGRRTAWTLLSGGAAGMAGLVLLAGYPASAVGVPGAGRSNLDPPSLFVVCLAVAQVGAALLVRPALVRLLAPERWWSPVRRLNAVAATGYLWHQPVLVAVTVLGGLLAGGASLPGLHLPPTGPGWLVARLCWLPVLAALLAAVLIRPARQRQVRIGHSAAIARKDQMNHE